MSNLQLVDNLVFASNLIPDTCNLRPIAIHFLEQLIWLRLDMLYIKNMTYLDCFRPGQIVQ